MAGSRKWQGLAVVAAVDLSGTTPGSGPLYKAISHAGNVVAVGSGALGLLQVGAQSGAHVDVGWEGDMKYVAAAAIVAGGLLAVTTSGYLTTPVSGAHVVGRNAELAVASGEIGEGTFNFAGGGYQWRPDSYNLDNLIGVATAADLTVANAVGKAFHATSGDFSLAAQHAFGAIAVGATSGGTALIKVAGVGLARAGNTIAIGDSLVVADSGWFITANSGDRIVGRALAAVAAAGSGGVFNALFGQGHYATSCLDVNYF